MRARLRWGAAIPGLAAALLGGVGSAAAGPIVLFNTFGEPGDTFDPAPFNGSFIFEDDAGQIYVSAASSFTPSTTAALSQIRFAALTQVPLDMAQQVDLIITADQGGAPGAVLDKITGVAVPDSQNGTIVTVNSASDPLLVAGVPYWLVMQPFEDGDLAVWNASSPPVTGTVLQGDSPLDPWSPAGTTLPAFELLGIAPSVAVPEPSSLALLALGGLGLAGWRGWKGKRTQATA